ncbi:hypothetical protein R1flu_024561 [Riccia fluitans]|uniref:F-box domain-containing protein n=1 Tax=Riccia fluitans TaxID=41844 RepID=A0ABD1XVP2_9MARC
MSKVKSIREETFDPALWRNFPEDLILIVLSKLRFQSLVPFRSVCKKWNEYIIERGQSLDPVEYQVAVPLPVRCRPGKFLLKELTVYNSKIGKWEKLSLAFTRRMQDQEMHTLAAADGGLLCFRNSTFTSFIVCNPLTRRWKCLTPPVTVWDICTGDYSELSNHMLVGLVIVSGFHSDRYKLVVAGLEENAKTLVYDSVEDEWSIGGPMVLPSTNLNREFCCLQYNGKSVSYSGHLYWLISDASLSWVSVVKYDLDHGSWLATNVARYPRGSLVRNYKGSMCVMNLDRARVPRTWEGTHWILHVHETERRFCLLSRRIPKFSIYKIDAMPRVSNGYIQEYHSCVGQGDSVFIVYKILAGTSEVGYRLVNFGTFMEKYDDLQDVSLCNPSNENQSWKISFMFSDMVEAETWWEFLPSLSSIV